MPNGKMQSSSVFLPKDSSFQRDEMLMEKAECVKLKPAVNSLPHQLRSSPSEQPEDPARCKHARFGELPHLLSTLLCFPSFPDEKLLVKTDLEGVPRQSQRVRGRLARLPVARWVTVWPCRVAPGGSVTAPIASASRSRVQSLK